MKLLIDEEGNCRSIDQESHDQNLLNKILDNKTVVTEIHFASIPEDVFSIASLLTQSPVKVKLCVLKVCNKKSFGKFLDDLDLYGVTQNDYEFMDEEAQPVLEAPPVIFSIDESTNFEEVDFAVIDHLYVRDSLSQEKINKLFDLIGNNDPIVFLSCVMTEESATYIKSFQKEYPHLWVYGFEYLDKIIPKQKSLHKLDKGMEGLVSLGTDIRKKHPNYSLDNLRRLLVEGYYWLDKLLTENPTYNGNFLQLSFQYLRAIEYKTEQDSKLLLRLDATVFNRELKETKPTKASRKKVQRSPVKGKGPASPQLYYGKTYAQVHGMISDAFAEKNNIPCYILLAPDLAPRFGRELQKDFPTIEDRKLLYGFEDVAKPEDFNILLKLLQESDFRSSCGISDNMCMYYACVIYFWKAFYVKKLSDKIEGFESCELLAENLSGKVEYAESFLTCVRAEHVRAKQGLFVLLEEEKESSGHSRVNFKPRTKTHVYTALDRHPSRNSSPVGSQLDMDIAKEKVAESSPNTVTSLALRTLGNNIA